jgi:hypothetical protein
MTGHPDQYKADPDITPGTTGYLANGHMSRQSVLSA